MQKKSPLQERAERAVSLFLDTARKPIVIEFSGTPKAGKTTTLSQISTFLKRCGFKVEIVVERANICPIKDKKHPNFNIWTACTTLAQLLEKTQTPPRPDDPQILILDRGIFDSICWIRLMEKLQRLRSSEREAVEKFLTISDWRERITGVILMTASPNDSMQREQSMLPVSGAKGSIMNEAVLKQMTAVAKNTAKEMDRFFQVLEVNTSAGETKGKPEATAEKVANSILSLIEQELREDILYLPKMTVKEFFHGAATIDLHAAENLIEAFHSSGEYSPRREVEADTGLVQALPVVVVRNASGQILFLRRREKTKDNPLHEKMVVWAGGHVRQEDNRDGQPILYCIMRELEEELRLRVTPDSLSLSGAIYLDEGASTLKHVAIVYEWRAPSDEVEVVLSNAEFFERHGTSLSGKFLDVAKITEKVNKGVLKEPWSVHIMTKFIEEGSLQLQRRLL
uniref:Predicted phosphoesterase, NUDIX family n=1 Tax=Candidatus Kentrum sp. MB TaxID=2138164 RepID=A0A451BG91_9GAMM|nr:MAG: Predicted phosphoesterase, NUDIX family [Candidatus Kentron sp. MB]VFK35496.1 MAG: Predicted phosphoesterase, NUDIX family [Candidatus Kentron sp. MB]VFK77309.1 MAG: Predicted phosphoesterase, NUDIX family [Candidatus Kentron sp. MB]